MLGAIGAVLGTGMSIAGSAMEASSASARKDALKRYANRIGLDVDDITGKALAGMEKTFPTATDIGMKINSYYSDELNKALEKAYPGYAGLMNKHMGNLGSLMSGEIPSDVQQNIFRSAAGRALMGGFSGGTLHRNLAARDLGTTSLGLMQSGMGMFSQVPSAFPRANQYDVSQLMGLTPQQLVNLRSQEQTQKYNILTQQAMLPSSSEVWGGALKDMGSTMSGMGVGSLLGGGGTSTGTSMPTAQQQQASWLGQYVGSPFLGGGF